MTTAETRVVALADSLALPRNEGGDLLLWEQTWPYRLERHLEAAGARPDVINCGQRARTADSLPGSEFDEHIVYKCPDVVILQLGVVDCAPRIFSRAEARWMSRRGFPSALRTALIARRSQRRAALTRANPLKKVYTPPNLFASSLRLFAERFESLSPRPLMVVVPVLESSALEAKSPGFESNRRCYNNYLQVFASRLSAVWVDLSHSSPDWFCSDGYHLNKEGSDVLARRLSEALLRASAEPLR